VTAHPYIIHTARDGELIDGGQAAVDEIFNDLLAAPKVVFHFHGGLVDEQSGRKVAAELHPVYRSAGATPVFFVWESGLLDVIRHNLPEIAGEDFFKAALKWIAKFVVGKFGEAAGVRSVGGSLPTPPDSFIYREFARKDAGQEPFDRIAVPSNLSEVTPEDEAELARALAGDRDFQETVQGIIDAEVPETANVGARGLTVRPRRSARSLMSPGLIDELWDDAAAARNAGSRGILSTATLVLHVQKVLRNVVSRLRRGHDHGIYPTIVEELLREFYIANAGLAVWSAMKKETLDTFGSSPGRGGSYAMRKLQELLVARSKIEGSQPVEVTLVGHSTGAVFINNLIAHLDARRQDSTDPFPGDFRFRNIIFLAPACTFRDFHQVLSTPRKELFQNFRMFTMTDATESRDQLVPYIYTRSLLYFISGVLEPGLDGSSAPDVPVVGLARYYDRPETYDSSEVASVRDFVKSQPAYAVWSPTDAGAPGLRTRAEKHGDFDNDPETRRSLVEILQGA
jgi:hypothetical protein